jgi:hypothetical protein
MSKNWLQVCFGVIPLLFSVLVFGQQAQAPSSAAAGDSAGISDQEIDLLRKDIRSQRKQIIAQNLNLTDAEAQRFWPVYDRCTAELIKINDTKFKLIQSYSQNQNQLNDEQVNGWIDQWLQTDADMVALQRKYVPEFRKVLPVRKVARFEQLYRRTQLMIDLQVASQIPLVPGH